MKFAKILCVLLAFTFATSCHQAFEDNIVGDDVVSGLYEGNPTTLASEKSYFPVGWEYLPTHSEKVQALQLDENLMRNLTTEELVDLCVNYPLAFDCFMFNDFNRGFERVLGNFNGFKELSARSDAKQELIRYYHNYVEQIYYNTLPDSKKINPLQLAFIELMVQSDYFGDLSLFTENTTLKDTILKVNILRESEEALGGRISKEVFERFSNDFFDKTFVTKAINSCRTEVYIKIHTKFGLLVDAITCECYSNQWEDEYGREHLLSAYPNAIEVGNASCEYNCHGYAWYMSDGGQTCWINASDNNFTYNTKNVEKFWKDGSYQECSASEATKVFYGAGEDHSAVVINPNLFESKWGYCHLMRHSPNDCPYKPIDLHYYKPTQIYHGSVYWSRNPDPLPKGYVAEFSITDTYAEPFRTEVYVTSTKDDEIVDSSICEIISSNHRVASLQFNKPGSYVVWFKIINTEYNCIRAIYESEYVYVQ